MSRTFIPGPLSSIIFVTYCLTAKMTFMILCLPFKLKFRVSRAKSTEICEEIFPKSQNYRRHIYFHDKSVPVPASEWLLNNFIWGRGRRWSDIFLLGIEFCFYRPLTCISKIFPLKWYHSYFLLYLGNFRFLFANFLVRELFSKAMNNFIPYLPWDENNPFSFSLWIL